MAIFLSYFIDELTPAYGGEKGAFKIQNISSIENGDRTNNSKIFFNSHIGTHIDFPLHFYKDGKSINDYDAAFWVFSNIGVIECSTDKIMENVDSLNEDIELLILKTNFSKCRDSEIYWKSQPIIESNIADDLKKKFPKLRVFGFDLISLTSKLNREQGRLAHLAFLKNPEILILEDMNLKDLDFKPNKVIISPLLIKNIEGVPCTVIAF